MNIIIILITLTIATITDYKNMKIPNWLTYPLIIVGILSLIGLSWQRILIRIGVAIGIIFLSRGGGGDKKLLSGISLTAGAPAALTTYILGGMLAGLSIILRNKYYTKSFFPYGIKYEFGRKIIMGEFFFWGFTGFLILRMLVVMQ